MIKNCIIYRFSTGRTSVVIPKNEDLRKITLSDCLKVSTGAAAKRIEGLKELAKNEQLTFLGEDKDNLLLSYSCSFRTRRLTAAGEVLPPYIPVNVAVWKRKVSPFVITFDAGRRLSSSAICLLSFATTGNPTAIEVVRFDKPNFVGLKKWVLSREGTQTGSIIRVTLQDVDSDSTRYKQVVLRASKLESSYLFQEMFDSSIFVSNLTFMTPPLGVSDRSLCCRLNYWGGITIYTPNPLLSEISELVSSLELIYGTRTK